MILVTGATGTVGSRVVEQLVARGAPVRALVRSPERAGALPPGVEAAVGSFDDPGSLDAALDGVERAFLLSPASPDQPALEQSLIDAAVRAGGVHVVKLSAIGADSDPGITFGRLHREVEVALEASGLPWTVLRPNGYFENVLTQQGSIVSAGQFYGALGDGTVSFIAAADIGAVAAAVLTGDGHAGKAYDLTGPEAIGHSDQAAVLAEVLGREIAYVDLPPEAFEQGMVQAGLDPWLAHALVELYGVYAQGYAAAVSPFVAELAGRPATGFGAWAEANASALAA